jgi:TonB-dependent starch-binding outer membrane protein SusC
MKLHYIVYILFLWTSTMFAQTVPVKGTIINFSDNTPIAGATVRQKGTTNGTISDLQGQFIIQAPRGSVLQISFVGMLSEEVTISGEAPVTIMLFPSMEQLEEFVVIGYGVKKKRDVIGSMTSVSGEELTALPSASITSALQGRAAGVTVTSLSGVPGSQVNIRIRGESSISLNSSPLWIIDGMPVYSGTGLERTIGSTSQDPMSMFNINDIESIEVLKDAAATSIYGSRGSNGVIIVTTKSGKKGKSSTNINVSSGITTLNRTPEYIGFTNTSEWMSLVDQGRANRGLGAFNPNDITKFYRDEPIATLTRHQAENINTDWFDQILRTGTFQDVNASSSRGTDNGSFFLSVNYNNTESVLKENYFQRFSSRANFDFKPLDNLSVGSRLNFSYTENTRVQQQVGGSVGGGGGGANAGWGNANRVSLPWFPVYNPSHASGYWNPRSGANLAASVSPDNHHDLVEQYRFLGNMFLDYHMPGIKGLKIRSEFSADFIQNNSIYWVSEHLRELGSYAADRAATRKSFNYNIYGNYNITISEVHNFNATLGSEWQTILRHTRDLTGQNLQGSYRQVGNPGTYLEMFSGLNEEEYILGYFGRFDYKLKDRYFASVSMRRDGSSKFQDDVRWAIFPAYSAGWIISDEPFLKRPWIEMIKLRGSYGRTGNKDIPSNRFQTNFSNRRDDRYGDATLIPGSTRISNLGNPILTWETTNSYDGGVDFAFFNNRLSGSVAYYLQRIDDLLLFSSLPVSSGVNGIWNNIGNMENFGWEYSVNSVNLHLPSRNFRWTTDFNFSTNDNKVLSLTPQLNQNGKGVQDNNTSTVSVTGGRLWAWHIAEFAGVDPEKGVDMIYEIDYELWQQTGKTVKTGRTIPATTANLTRNRFIHQDKTRVPKYTGGINNKIEYGGFDLSMLITFAGGHYIYDYEEQRTTAIQYGQVLLRKDLIGNTWQKPGDQARYPELTWDSQYPWGWDHEAANPQWSGDPNSPLAKGTWVGGLNGNQTYSYNNETTSYSRHLYKGDYFRLQNIEAGYRFRNTYLTRMGLQHLRVSASATNLILYTLQYRGWDPETGGGVLPPLKVYNVGLSVQF